MRVRSDGLQPRNIVAKPAHRQRSRRQGLRRSFCSFRWPTPFSEASPKSRPAVGGRFANLRTWRAVASSAAEFCQALSGSVSENAEQVNLAAEGFGKIVGQFPGFPLIVGPFGFFDVRAVLTQSLVNINALDTTRSAEQSSAAAKLSYQDAREMVVLVVGAGYLATVASAARVDSAQAQLQTAQALYDQAVDLKKNRRFRGDRLASRTSRVADAAAVVDRRAQWLRQAKALPGAHHRIAARPGIRLNR